ncbi:hypothetical protein HUT18_04935 [Streptomyces sp. NA04227]|uniref:hypothetical protein n=1 Tax=Streptomyces sp. NA04227 TaxID=2742136 RepID=UPI00158FF2E4|nr:hypothetical protein [Streptomyces sp. NA04227]QKW05825.1 hypothetical protein HUT18_04935 [Streptomyces sp. NA04227]
MNPAITRAQRARFAEPVMTPELALILSRRGLVLHGWSEGSFRIRTVDGPVVGRAEAGGEAWNAWARRYDGHHALVATGLPGRDAAVCAVADHAIWEDLTRLQPPESPRRYPMTGTARRRLHNLTRDAHKARAAGDTLHTVELRLNPPRYGKQAARRTTRGVDEAIRAVEGAGWQCCGVEPWLGTGALLSFVRTPGPWPTGR